MPTFQGKRTPILYQYKIRFELRGDFEDFSSHFTFDICIDTLTDKKEGLKWLIYSQKAIKFHIDTNRLKLQAVTDFFLECAPLF